MTRLPDFTIAVPAVLLAAACASTADSVDEPSSGKVDRTGSSLPAKDYGAANVRRRGSRLHRPRQPADAERAQHETGRLPALRVIR